MNIWCLSVEWEGALFVTLDMLAFRMSEKNKCESGHTPDSRWD